MDNTNLRATEITQPRVTAKKLAEEKKILNSREDGKREKRNS